MKKLFYVFLIIWLINIIIHGLFTFFNLAIFGVFWLHVLLCCPNCQMKTSWWRIGNILRC